VRVSHNSITLRHTGPESHNILGKGESLRSSPSRVYNKVIRTHPTAPKEVALALATLTMNCIAGPEDLVPSLTFSAESRHAIDLVIDTDCCVKHARRVPNYLADRLRHCPLTARTSP
jgi:hypothetical protein